MENAAPHFATFFQAGFECTYALPKNGKRLHILSASRHDVCQPDDYRLILDLGIRTVREGFSWSEIDKGNGEYDFSRFLPLLAVGKEMGIQQIWDLNHFDYPESLDFFSEDFPRRFAAYALRVHEVLRRFVEGTLYIVPINEISYFSWIAGAEGQWAPFARGRGMDCKRQLVRASLAAMQAIWLRDRDVRFIHPDPAMYRRALDENDPVAVGIARDFLRARFEAWDMLAGKVEPELGGEPVYLDIIGVNYYYNNQEWVIRDTNNPGAYASWGMHWQSPERISFAQLLYEIHERYQRPMVVTETGSHGDLRERWWIRTLSEIDDALQTLPLYGICAYPVIDYPDWHGHHLTNSGFWDFETGDKACRRIPHAASIAIVKEYMRKWQEKMPSRH